MRGIKVDRKSFTTYGVHLCFIKTTVMNTIFDSILLNSLQMEGQSGEVTIDCTVFENGEQYQSEMVLTSTAMNRLLNELSCRDIDLDFDRNWDEVILPGGDVVYHMQFDGRDQSPVFLPLYVMPERIRLMRA